MRAARYILAGAALCIGAAAFAQKNTANNNAYRYRWKDASGQSYFSDSLTSDAMKAGYDVVNSQGMVVRHVDRQLTADERAAARKVADAQAAAQQAQQQRQREDAQMLNAYPDEAAFAAAKSAEVDNFEQAARTTRLNLQGQEKALADLLNRAGDLERAKQPVPKYLGDRIAEQRNTVASLRATLQRQQAAKDAAKANMEAQLRHYRELKAADTANGGR
ncbi:small-conductance mechanosensitive channel [Luteibacter jiangsuensis]|uniref:Small-conductance mechanosensitive channel n=1 Tax=Luteibacter jiangsuensis TaxID=637577 RepID=A0ABT9SY29_9GAMM|nr:DUF4124 domain-containing protein [Luteibacter jiangsuensis]MDQ0009459.1 small-conductance mechanosensitive channel [Luteibacter jiangsuensis]